MNRSTKADLILIFIVSLWGTSFALVKGALEFISPILFIILRFLLAGAVWGVLYGRLLAGARRGTWSRGILLGAVLGGGFVLQTMGLMFTTAGMSGFITGLGVVVVPLLVVLIERKLPKVTSLVGVGICTVGLLVLSSPAGEGLNRGDVMTVGSAVLFALYIVLVEMFTAGEDYDPGALILATAFGALLVSLVTMPFVERPYVEWTGPLLWRVAVLGGMAALTFALQLYWQRFISATRTAIIFTLEPPLAALFGFLLLGEVLTVAAYVGGGLIFLGMLVAEGGARLLPAGLRRLR